MLSWMKLLDNLTTSLVVTKSDSKKISQNLSHFIMVKISIKNQPLCMLSKTTKVAELDVTETTMINTLVMNGWFTAHVPTNTELKMTWSKYLTLKLMLLETL